MVQAQNGELWHTFFCIICTMRKLLLLAVMTIGMVASSVAQLAIPGEVFAQNPARFNGRKVTIKNIEIVSQNFVGSAISGPAIGPTGGSVALTPGAIGTPTQPNVAPCRPPRGFSQVELFFKGEPEFKACFFMSDAMKAQLNREMGGQNVDAMITFRGDHRTGYNVTFYRLGQ